MLYHVVKETHWNTFKKSNLYFSETFDTENFIHLSEASQIKGVLKRYYKNQNNLLILCIEKEKLTSDLIYEKATNNDYFPHLYGGLNINAISKIIKGTYLELIDIEL
ncbi:DUF952 domain-containing protein [Lacihabitans soyangensis]|nr:DUF952 domain-containing protein [Lacihabitans soyangensis]